MHHTPGYMPWNGLGARLRRAREQRGLLLSAVAKLLGVSRQTLHRWETDAFEPSVEMLARLSELYGVTIDFLIHGDTAA
jgi:transcriptional regulator with XRE-family HTH domain